MAKRAPATKATPSARAPARKPRRTWHVRFLEGFALTGTVKGGCAHAKVHRSVVYRERQRSEEFALAWAAVEEDVTDGLEQTALTLALAGEVKLIEFLLKARRPDIYRERHTLEHTGPDGGPITAEIVTVDAKEASDAAHDFLERLAGAEH